MRKNIFFLSCILIIIFLPQKLHSQTWQWARQAGASYNVLPYSVTCDSIGNSYVTGVFFGYTVTFGGYALTDTMGTDIFLVKYDANGNVIWAKNFGGKDLDWSTSSANDAYGNIYVTGWFYSDTIYLGADTLIHKGVSGYISGTTDMFLAKFDCATGNVLWAKDFGGLKSDSALAVSTDHYGNIYLSGTFNSDTLIFDNDTLFNSNNINYYDMFLSKYDANGNELWARKAFGDKNDYATSVSCDGYGNVYVAGFFQSSFLVFNSISLTNYSITNKREIYIAKYDTDGNALWAKSARGTNNDYATSVAADQVGNAYLAGYYYSNTLVFDTITLYNTNPHDLFISKYDKNGNVRWAKSVGGDNGDFAWSVAVDNSGNNIFLDGHFSSDSIKFDSITLYSPNNSKDIFVANYDSLGNVIWAIKPVGNDEDVSYSLATIKGVVFVTGQFQSPTLSFGSTTLTTNNGVIRMFVAKLNTLTGINEYNSHLDFLIFPNPSSDNIIIAVLQKSEIEIFNIEGQLIKRIKANTGNATIDVSGFARGLYFVKLKTAKGIKLKKFIKD